jgi:hypothetical protein
MTTQNTKTTAAERNFNGTIEVWKALGLEVTIEDNDSGVFAHTATARVSARGVGISVFQSVTLRRPKQIIEGYAPRTSLRHLGLVWNCGTSRKVDARTALSYLRDACRYSDRLT